MAVSVPSISCCVLNHHNIFYQIQNALAFNWNTCCHLVLCLQLLPFHFMTSWKRTGLVFTRLFLCNLRLCSIVFFPAKPFQHFLMFEVMERLANDKHSSLLDPCVSFKKMKTYGPYKPHFLYHEQQSGQINKSVCHWQAFPA
jgi:hypothetical protein